MGSNIHIVGPKNVHVDLAPFPEEFGTGVNSCTLPRFTDSYKFMRLLWDDESTECVSMCSCDANSRCDYFCDYPLRYRPTNFEKLKKDSAELGEVFLVLVNYLESEPNAWLEYD